MIDLTTVKNADPEVYEAMKLELDRQRGNIELIASENFVSPAVMAAVGSHLTNKYAEGLPANAITAAVSMWTSSKISPSSGANSCSDVIMRTSSRTAAHRRIPPCTLPFYSPAIPFSA